MLEFLSTYIEVIPLIILLVALTTTFILLRRTYRKISMIVTQSIIGGVITVLKCPICNFTMTREFRLGDYIGKVVDEKCPNDNNNLVIVSISRKT